MIGLALLILANGVVLGVVAYVLSTWVRLIGLVTAPFWIRLLNSLFDGVLTAQLLLIGLWCALAPERLVQRLLVGIVLAALPVGI
ncbi:MAG TPA: hypothetical protein VFB80_12535, partial [Pirellulaceae bacterium]|nr:hypothetical protein [Pirellulaceae bacterium]